MRKKEALSSPEVTGLGADALIRDKNTDEEADCRWSIIAESRLGRGNNSRTSVLSNSRSAFSLVLMFITGWLGLSSTSPSSPQDPGLQDPVYASHLLRQEREYGRSHTGPLKLLPRSDTSNIPLTFHC